MHSKRLMSAAALAAAGAIALTGCSGKDVADKAKQHASALATNSMAQSVKSKGAAAIKSKMNGSSSASADPNGSAAPGDASSGAAGDTGAGGATATVSLGRFAKNPAAKTVGAFFTARQAALTGGRPAAIRKVSSPAAFKAAKRYVAQNQGKAVPFSVTVTGVKGKRVMACVGPKAKTSRTVIVRNGRVMRIRNSSATCK